MSQTTNSIEEYMKQGASLLIDGKHEEAEKVYRQAIELKADHAWANCNLGRSLLYQGKIEVAIPYLQKAIELDGDMAEAYFNLGNAFTQQNRFEEAVNAYQKAIELEPQQFLYHHQLGDSFLLQGKYEAAVSPYRKAIELNSEYVWSYCNLGKAFSALERWEEGTIAYKRAIELDANLPAWVYENLGHALSFVNQSKQEFFDHQRQTQSKDSSDKSSDLTEQNTQSDLSKFIHRLNMKFHDAHHQLLELISKADQVVINTIEVKEEPSEDNLRDAENYLRLGEESLSNKHLDKAIDFFQKAVKADHNLAKAYHKLGDTLSKQSKLDEAVTMYCKSILLDSEAGWSYHNLAGILSKQARQEEAIVAYKKSVESDPTVAQFYHSLGDLLSKQGYTDEAISSYRYAINLNSSNPWLYYNLAKRLNTQNHYLEAGYFCMKALYLKSNFSEAENLLSLLRQRTIKAYQSFDLANLNPFVELSDQEFKDNIQIVSNKDKNMLSFYNTQAINKGSDNDIVYTCFGAGDSLILNNSFIEAIYCFNKALSLSLEQVEFHQAMEVSVGSLISALTLEDELTNLSNVTMSNSLGIPW